MDSPTLDRIIEAARPNYEGISTERLNEGSEVGWILWLVAVEVRELRDEVERMKGEMP